MRRLDHSIFIARELCSLAKNRINDDGVEALAEMLFENFTLKKLA